MRTGTRTTAPAVSQEAGETGTSNPRELGAFLRAHRERRSPEDIGLPDHGRRRTPGLRREEVAALSGVGLAWYTWLEQGRVVPSKNVLEAVARTLGLDEAGRRHMLALAGLLPPAPRQAGQEELAAQAQPLLDGWEHCPALLLDSRLDIVAWNTAYAAVWSDPGELPPSRRNLMWCVVGVSAIRDTVVEWQPLAEAIRAHFRAQTARRPGDERVRELYRLLQEDFPDLAAWWECQGIADLTARQVVAQLPGHGPLHLLLSAFRPVDASEGLLLVQSPQGEADRALVDDLVRRRESVQPRTAPSVVRIHRAAGQRRVG